MRPLIDEYTKDELVDYTLSYFHTLIQKQRQPHCEAVRFRFPLDAVECGATADGFDPTYGWLCRTCAKALEVKFAEA